MKRPFLSLSFAVLMSLSLGPACAPPSGDQSPVCGNGVVEAGEDCDDGNTVDGDGCRKDCTVEECGDGIRDPGEQCDDGNTIAGDGCDASCQAEGPSEQEQIDEFIRGQGHIPFDPEGSVPGTTDPATTDAYYTCTVSHSTNTQDFSADLSAVLKDLGFLFPGSIIQGNSLATSEFNPAVFERKPLEYTLSISDNSGKTFSATMQNPSLADFDDTRQQLLAGSTLGSTPITAIATITEVTSEDDLSLAVSADVKSKNFKFDGSFDFSDKTKRSHFLVEVDEEFFTATAVDPVRPSDFLADSVTLDQVKQTLGEGNPPAYVSSVTYGMRLYLAIDSSFSAEETKAALQAAFQGGNVTADVNAAFSNQQIVNSLHITSSVVGADSKQSAEFLAAVFSPDPFSAFQKLMQSGQTFDITNFGAPIAFTVKHLADDSTATVSLTADVATPTCVRIGEDIQATFNSLALEPGGSDDKITLFGSVTASGLEHSTSTIGGVSVPTIKTTSSATLLSLDQTQEVTITNQDKGEFTGGGPQFTKVLHLNLNDSNPLLNLQVNLTKDGFFGNTDLPPTTLQLSLPTQNDQLSQDQVVKVLFNGDVIDATVGLKPVQNN